MDVAWNFRREHLRLQQRSHNVITDGGDQPNVVPSTATVWYYFRETDYAHIKELREIGDRLAKAAASMTDTEVSSRLLGSAWPGNMSKPIAEAMYSNVDAVGLPKWDEADQALAKALQKELKQPEIGLPSEIPPTKPGLAADQNYGGGSDDIGDVSWTVPTATLRYPANIPNLPGHNWANAVAMATPIAHKGTTAGAKVQAMTMLDFLTRPELVQQAHEYFETTTTKDQKYQPLIGPDDKPAIHLNAKTLEQYRPAMRKYYFDSSKYKTYLEQLGVKYPDGPRHQLILIRVPRERLAACPFVAEEISMADTTEIRRSLGDHRHASSPTPPRPRRRCWRSRRAGCVHLLPWTPVEAGTFRVNRVSSDVPVDVACGPRDERDLPETFVDYDEQPRSTR